MNFKEWKKSWETFRKKSEQMLSNFVNAVSRNTLHQLIICIFMNIWVAFVIKCVRIYFKYVKE